MNKAKRLIGAAAMLAVLILAGCDFLKNPEYADSIPLPPALPVAKITGTVTDSGTGISVGSYSYALEWMMPPTKILSPNAEYPLDSPENIAALNDALAVWREYETRTDPLPGYKLPGVEGKTTDGVFREGLLDNSPAALSDGRRLIIPRYWPRSYVDRPIPVTPTRETWMSNHEQRAADFLKARQAILDMIVLIVASPLYEVVDPATGSAPLQTLQARMEAYIDYPNVLYDREYFDIAADGVSGTIDTAQSGPLFEYYFGYIPANDESGYVIADGPYAF
jgi:hypothetical protein